MSLERGVICEIRAGRCRVNDKIISPIECKGYLRLFRGNDELLSVQWLTREEHRIEDTLYIFDDAYLEKVEKCTTGQVYVLKFTSSNQINFYWMQETNLNTIQDFVNKFNTVTGYKRD